VKYIIKLRDRENMKKKKRKEICVLAEIRKE
jgi:hypothetical protein